MEWLNIREGGTYVDGTAGGGGHSTLIAERMKSGRLIALDRDPVAVLAARTRLAPFEFAEVFHRNYGDLAGVLSEQGLTGADGVLIDAGLSSMQLDDPGRGFSFQSDGPLDMRMDTSSSETAAILLDRIRTDELAALLRDFGDVKPAKRIADAIIHRRDAGELKTTRDLAEAVRDGLPFVKGTPEETRTVFQAIRMAVNRELLHLETALHSAIDNLRPGGRIVVISFHSGEDRVVKNVFKDASRPNRVLWPDGRVKHVVPERIRVLTRKPVEPEEAEKRRNPRSCSARLRAAERL